MIIKKEKFYKFITGLILIILIVTPLFAVPQKTTALTGGIVHDPVVGANTLKSAIKDIWEMRQEIIDKLEKFLKKVLQVMAARAMLSMSKSTVNWINSGFHGVPLFLENPDSFFKDIVKSEVKKLIDTFGRDPLRFPYGRIASLNFIDAYKQRVDTNAAYSLSNVINDEAYLSNYRSNFNIGGWNGLLLHTQYPQNNAIGFQMLANEELARRIDVGPIPSNEIGKVQNLLQQGQGFLSPQICSTNSSYYNLINPYKPATFKYDEEWDPPPLYDRTSYMKTDPQSGLRVPDDAAYLAAKGAYDLYVSGYNSREGIAQTNWSNVNKCPPRADGSPGLINTTPGGVVANEIMESLNMGREQALLANAMGNSLTAIFDALLNKLINKDGGLNALASRSNERPTDEDNWDYLGNTLGSPSTSYDPFVGPDQEIILSEFRTAVENGIADTQKELDMMDNPSSTDQTSPEYGKYGMIQYLSAIWPTVRQLDICLPGPNYKWEERLDDEVARVSIKMQEKMMDKNASKAQNATLVFKELKFAVDFFKDWVKTKMMFSLPSAPAFLDEINSVETYDQIVRDVTEKKRIKIQALAWLQAIDGQLESFTEQPLPDTPDEKLLIDQRKRYDTVRYSISNVETIGEAKAQLESLADKLAELNEMTNECSAERRSKGWNVLPEWNDADGETSVLLTQVSKPPPYARGTTYLGRYFIPITFGGGWTGSASLRVRTGTEKEQFCSRPISGGYTHEKFVNPNDPNRGGKNVEYPQIPLANTRTQGDGDNFWIILSCNTVYRSYALDYKGSVPGEIEIEEAPPPPNDSFDADDTTPPPPPGTPPPGSEPPPPENCGGAGQIACL